MTAKQRKMFAQANEQHQKVCGMYAAHVHKIYMDNLRSREAAAFGPPHPVAVCIAIGIFVILLFLAIIV